METEFTTPKTLFNVAVGTHNPTPGQEWAVDVNEDGKVNIVDAIVLVNMILGD